MLDFPPPPSDYDRKTAMRQALCKPETATNSFLTAQLQHIKDEINESDLCPGSISRPSADEC